MGQRLFTDEQIEQYRTRGFLQVDHFFGPEEVAVIQDEVVRFQKEGLLRNVSTDGDGKTTSQTSRNLQLCPTAPHSPRFRALPFSPKVRQAVEELVGEPARLLLDQVFLKPAGDGAGTSYHQDNAYFGLENPMMGMGMWIAVHDASIANGTMHMVPDSWQTPLEHVRDGNSDHHVRCYPDETREVACEMAAGGALFFCYGTPHCTKGNRTDRDRAGLAYHFYHSDHKPAGFVQSDDTLPLVSGPDASGGARELGEDQRGRWEQFVQELVAR